MAPKEIITYGIAMGSFLNAVGKDKKPDQRNEELSDGEREETMR